MNRLKSLIFAVQFLTIVPLKKDNCVNERVIAGSAMFFPLVGLFLGSVLILIDILLVNIFPDYIINIIIVFTLAVITGGLHLDGLADTVDGFYAGKNKAEILRIMRDSSIGTMGMLGLACIILLKIGFLQALAIPSKYAALLVMPVLSRWSMAFSICCFDYAREEGKAKYFFKSPDRLEFIIASLFTCAVVFFIFKWHGLLLMLLISLSTLIFGIRSRSKINGITGDTLGAINEINEVLVLLLVYIMQLVM
ncbi:adenosylcobinamide-GDP ribazoletransferase [Elusimicrobiota bacterium]